MVRPRGFLLMTFAPSRRPGNCMPIVEPDRLKET
jgi:hypothetical protein